MLNTPPVTSRSKQKLYIFKETLRACPLNVRKSHFCSYFLPILEYTLNPFYNVLIDEIKEGKTNLRDVFPKGMGMVMSLSAIKNTLQFKPLYFVRKAFD